MMLYEAGQLTEEPRLWIDKEEIFTAQMWNHEGGLKISLNFDHRPNVTKLPTVLIRVKGLFGEKEFRATRGVKCEVRQTVGNDTFGIHPFWTMEVTVDQLTYFEVRHQGGIGLLDDVKSEESATDVDLSGEFALAPLLS